MTSALLGDHIDILSGFAFSSEYFNQDEGMPVVRIRDVVRGFTETRFCGDYDHAYLVNDGDTLIGMDGQFNVGTWFGGKALLNQRVCRVKAKRTLSPRFLHHLLPQALKKIEDSTPFVTVKHLSVKDIRTIQINLPPMEEQRRIAAILDQAEALRAKRRQALAKLDTLTQSLFLEMFGDAATNPKGLKIEPLGKHLRFITSGGRGWAKFYSAHGSRFIRSLDVRMNHIGDDDVVYVDPPDNAEARRTKVETGDVLLTITGSRIGRVATASKDLDGAYISQHVAILRPKPDGVDPDFLSFFLSLEVAGQRQIAASQYGQTKPGLNFEQIQRFAIPVPPLNQQREFRRRLNLLKMLKNTGNTAIASQDSLFTSIQHRAFRGEL